MPDLAGGNRVLKRFRVAREGQTVDGRALSRQEIQEMAETYNPENYGARINVEHISGWSPDPPFNAYGDIVLVEAVEEGGKFCLYNTISALPNLVELNKSGQKIYPSIEFYRDFAGSGKAYQVGLGLTDKPASLGTEPLKFSSNPKLLRTVPDTEIVMSAQPTPAPAVAITPAEQKTMLSQLIEVLTPKPKEVPVPAVPTAEDYNATLFQGLMTALSGIKHLNEQFTALRQELTPTPATPVITPTAPVTQAVQPEVPTASAVPQPDQLLALTQQVQQLGQQLQTLANTPVNSAPPQSGATGDRAPY